MPAVTATIWKKKKVTPTLTKWIRELIKIQSLPTQHSCFAVTFRLSWSSVPSAYCVIIIRGMFTEINALLFSVSVSFNGVATSCIDGWSAQLIWAHLLNRCSEVKGPSCEKHLSSHNVYVLRKKKSFSLKVKTCSGHFKKCQLL